MNIISTRAAELNKPFYITVPNGKVKEVDVLGDFNPYKVKAVCNKSDNHFPPAISFKEKIDGGYRFKLDFSHSSYLISESYEFVFFDIDKYDVQVKKESQPASFSLLNSVTLPAKIKKVKSRIRVILIGLLVSILTTFTFYAVLLLDKKLENKTGGHISKFYNNFFSYSATEKAIEKVENKIVKKDHPVFSYDDFKDLQLDLSEDGFGFDLRSNFSHAGKDLFAMNNLHRSITTTKSGEVIKSLDPTFLTREEALEICEKYKSRLPTRLESDFILTSRFSGIKDKFYKIKTESEYPEWVSDDFNDDMDVYMKANSTLPLRFKMINGVKVVGDEETLSPFRCVFEAKDFE